MMSAARHRPAHTASHAQKGHTVTLAADFGTGEVLWSFLWFFMFFIFIMLIFQIFGDIIRSDDLSGWGKALWSLFIIFMPFLGIFVYVIARGGKMHERQIKAAQANEAGHAVVHPRHRRRRRRGDAAGAARRPAHRGKLDDAEYAAAKAKVIA